MGIVKGGIDSRLIEFNNYRNNFNYQLPTPAVARAKPYYIVKKGIYGREFNHLDTNYWKLVDREAKSLMNLLEKLIKIETGKEKFFLKGLLSKIEQQDPRFFNELKNKGYSSNSQLMELIDLRKRNLLALNKSWEQNIKDYTNLYAQFQNRYFLGVAEKVIKDKYGRNTVNTFRNRKDVEDKTFDQLLIEIREAINADVSRLENQAFASDINETWRYMEQDLRARIGENGLSKTLRDKVTEKFLEEEAKYNTSKKNERRKFTTIKQFVRNLVYGWANGLSAEETNSVTGGVHTGDYKISYANTPGLKDIQSDSITFYTASWDVEPRAKEQIEKIFKEAGQELKDGHLEKLTELYNQYNFVVHYSMKDLFHNSTHRTATIRQKESLASRIPALKNIAEQTGITSMDDLAFQLVNTAKGAIYEDNRESIKSEVMKVCMAWMFEDYVDTFDQFASDTMNNQLHVYKINGNIYFISDILRSIYNYVSDVEKNTKLINISLTVPDRNFYGEMRNSDNQYEGIERWDATAQAALEGIKLGIEMNTLQLEQLIYNIKLVTNDKNKNFGTYL